MIKKIILSFGLCAWSFLNAMESVSKDKQIKDFKNNQIWILEKNSLPDSVKTLIEKGKAPCKALKEIRDNLFFRFVQATDPYVQDIIFVKPDQYKKDFEKKDDCRKSY